MIGMRGMGLLVGLAVLVPRLVASQTTHHHVGMARPPSAGDEEFVRQVRATTLRYHHLDSAIVDGFRRVGPDIPTLGEHWVSIGRIAADGLVADRPPVLIYARARGRATLVGVAYTAFLAAGEPYPDVPVPAPYWHEHNGSLTDEILPLSHGAAPAMGDRARVAVGHAWIWADNPAGLWKAENWSLPYLRAGFVSDTPKPDVARALSLLDGAGYYATVLARSGPLDAVAAAAVRRVLESAAARVDTILARSTGRTSLDASQEARLAAIWSELRDRLLGMWTPAQAARLAPILGGHRAARR